MFKKPSKPYMVGRNKPPKEHQFKSGQSGNTKGRKKGSKNFDTALDEALEAPVQVTEGGKTRKLKSRAAIAKRLVAKALGGDARSIQLVMEHEERKASRKAAEAVGTTPLPEEDEITIAAYLLKIQKKANPEAGL